LGQNLNLQPSLAYEPSHNLKAEDVKKTCQWHVFSLKVEHGDSRAQTALVRQAKYNLTFFAGSFR